MSFDLQYKELLARLVKKYDETQSINGDRTGVGTVKLVGGHFRIDLSEGLFPLLTLKKTVWLSMIYELLWFLSGNTSNDVLEALGCKFWRPWAVTEKDLVLYYVKRNSDHDSVYRELTPSSEVDWGVILTTMIDNGMAPSDCRKHIGQLGPIYSKTWTRLPDYRVFYHPVDGDEDRRLRDEGFTLYTPDLMPVDENMGPAEHLTIAYRDINQIQNAINSLRKDPNSRRIIVNAWEPRWLPVDHWPDGSKKTPQENVIEGRAALAYCHAFFQFVTEELTFAERHAIYINQYDDHPMDMADPTPLRFDELRIPTHRLSCVSTIRSSDSFLGLPVNVASYALLTMMVAQCVNMEVGELIVNTGDTHLYVNHIEQARTMLERDPLPYPTVRINPNVKDIFQFKVDDFELVDYECHPALKGDPAV